MTQHRVRFALPLALALLLGFAPLAVRAASPARPHGSKDEKGKSTKATRPARATESGAPAAGQANPPAPVMPLTVVRPGEGAAAAAPAGAAAAENGRPSKVSLGEHGVIELGQQGSRSSRWKGFPISLSLRDAPLPEVLRSFARLAGMNLVLNPQVQGTVTVELHDVPWDQALYVILKSQGMGAEIDGNVWTVAPY
jgi:hypothetical protein